MSRNAYNKPEWNDRFYDTKSYKATKTELLEKKISMRSKNSKIAREEWRQKQKALRKGVIPSEYKQYVGPKQK